jgi:hypothetical protein
MGRALFVPFINFMRHLAVTSDPPQICANPISTAATRRGAGAPFYAILLDIRNASVVLLSWSALEAEFRAPASAEMIPDPIERLPDIILRTTSVGLSRASSGSLALGPCLLHSLDDLPDHRIIGTLSDIAFSILHTTTARFCQNLLSAPVRVRTAHCEM